MINREELIKHGYKTYDSDVLYNAVCLYQKRIKDDKGTKYFIDIYEYRLKSKDNYDKCKSYEARLVTSLKDDTYNLNILLYCIDNNTTIKQLEKDIEDIWTKLGCDYYEKSND